MLINKTSIVITRPINRADKLITELVNLGYDVINIPCIEIKNLSIPLVISTQHESIVDKDLDLQKYSIIVFVSVNAVVNFFNVYNNIKFTNDTKIFAIGSATANKLLEYKINHNINNIIYPKDLYQETSEYFVQLPDLVEISKDNILLVRGDASREYIANNLSRRAASFTDLITYNVVCTDGIITRTELGDLSKIIILFTSVSCLENFYNKLDSSTDDINLKKDILEVKTLLVSQRILNRAKELGFKKIYCTDSMNDYVIIDMINTIKLKK